MYLEKDIIKEGNPILRQKCTDVKFPMSKSDFECGMGLFEYVMISAIDELVKEYNIRPGVGIAAPQVGLCKRMFAINCTDFLDENEKKYSYLFINPIILAKSKDMTYLPGGEGCLSVDRATNGLVTPRHYAIKIKATTYDINTKKFKTVTMSLEGYPAIVFQHEYDHLDGILFVDKMYKESELNIPPLFVEEDENSDK